MQNSLKKKIFCNPNFLQLEKLLIISIQYFTKLKHFIPITIDSKLHWKQVFDIENREIDNKKISLETNLRLFIGFHWRTRSSLEFWHEILLIWHLNLALSLDFLTFPRNFHWTKNINVLLRSDFLWNWKKIWKMFRKRIYAERIQCTRFEWNRQRCETWREAKKSDARIRRFRIILLEKRKNVGKSIKKLITKIDWSRGWIAKKCIVFNSCGNQSSSSSLCQKLSVSFL